MSRPLEITPLLKFLLLCHQFGGRKVLVATNRIAQEFPGLKLYERRTWNTSSPWCVYTHHRKVGRNYDTTVDAFKVKMLMGNCSPALWRMGKTSDPFGGFPIWGWYEAFGTEHVEALRTRVLATNNEATIAELKHNVLVVTPSYVHDRVINLLRNPNTRAVPSTA